MPEKLEEIVKRIEALELRLENLHLFMRTIYEMIEHLKEAKNADNN